MKLQKALRSQEFSTRAAPHFVSDMGPPVLLGQLLRPLAVRPRIQPMPGGRRATRSLLTPRIDRGTLGCLAMKPLRSSICII
jgi:hypothetical protein